VRSAGDRPTNVTVTVHTVTVGKDFLDQPETPLLRKVQVVNKEWQPVTAEINVAPRTDRLGIHIAGSPGNAYVAEPSLRRVAQ